MFGNWYGKSPGVDRCMDALRHANTAGSSAHGGVLVLTGDDHPGRSATVPNQSELDLIAAAIPVFNPASIADYLRLGIHGMAMSRYSGCWSGMIVLAETVDGAASIDLEIEALRPIVPQARAAGVHIRWPDPYAVAEARLHEQKLPAVLEYARVNRLNRVLFGNAGPVGDRHDRQAYLDVMQAFAELDIGEDEAAAAGVRLMKADLIWPLEPTSARDFAAGPEERLTLMPKKLQPNNELRLYQHP